MDSIILKVLEYGSSTPKTLEGCISLKYVKEYYTPYSTLTASFILDQYIGEIIDVELSINGVTVHKGIIDTSEIKQLSSYSVLNISSRGHTSMLAQNETTPGIISNVSLNTLMTNYIQIPNVYHQNLSAASNYLFVKEHSSMWEAVANLCLKQYFLYPYIANVNTVRFTAPANPKHIVLSRDDGNIISSGSSYDYSDMISNYHMADTEGTYNTFNRSDSYVSSRGIVRHRHIAFDRQWLDDPIRGLGYRINFGMRGCRTSFVSYLGNSGEDIRDLVSYGELLNKSISKIEISGGSKGLVTKLTSYYDRYNNV